MKRILTILCLIISLVFPHVVMAEDYATEEELANLDLQLLMMRLELDELYYQIDALSSLKKGLVKIENDQQLVLSEARKLRVSGFGFASFDLNMNLLNTSPVTGTDIYELGLIKLEINQSADTKIESDFAIFNEWRGPWNPIRLDGFRAITAYRNSIITAGNYRASFSPFTLAIPQVSSLGQLNLIQEEEVLQRKLNRQIGQRELNGLKVELKDNTFSANAIVSRLEKVEGTNPYNSFLLGSKITWGLLENKANLAFNYVATADYPIPDDAAAIDAVRNGQKRPPVGNHVAAMNFTLAPAQVVSIRGEYAVSNYDHNLMNYNAEASLPGVSGQASYLDMGLDFNNVKVGLSYRKIAPDFIAFGAQQVNTTEGIKFTAGQYGDNPTTLSGRERVKSQLDPEPFGLATANRSGATVKGAVGLGVLGSVAFEGTKLQQIKATDANGNPINATSLFNYDKQSLNYQVKWKNNSLQLVHQKLLCTRDDDESTPANEKFTEESVSRGLQWNRYIKKWDTTLAWMLAKGSESSVQSKTATIGGSYKINNNAKLGIYGQAVGDVEELNFKSLVSGWENGRIFSRLEVNF